MKKLVLAALMAAVPVLASAEVVQLNQTTGLSNKRSAMTGYYDQTSQQYCLVIIDADGVGMDCKPVHELSEQAQRNILGDSYEADTPTGN